MWIIRCKRPSGFGTALADGVPPASTVKLLADAMKERGLRSS